MDNNTEVQNIINEHIENVKNDETLRVYRYKHIKNIIEMLKKTNIESKHYELLETIIMDEYKQGFVDGLKIGFELLAQRESTKNKDII